MVGTTARGRHHPRRHRGRRAVTGVSRRALRPMSSPACSSGERGRRSRRRPSSPRVILISGCRMGSRRSIRFRGVSSGVRSGELFAALSLATDLGTGQPSEHGLRTCLLATELATLAGLEGEELEDAFYLGLLHSIGCTADAPVTARAFGDNRRSQGRVHADRSRAAGRDRDLSVAQRVPDGAAAAAPEGVHGRGRRGSGVRAGQSPQPLRGRRAAGGAVAAAAQSVRGPVVRVRALGREGDAERSRRRADPDRRADPACRPRRVRVRRRWRPGDGRGDGGPLRGREP